MNPSIPQKERIVSLDIIRGLALFGILFINVKGYILLTEGMDIPVNNGINAVIDTLINIFVEKKFFSIFSFLFGVGFYIFASRAEKRGDKPLRRFSRRLLTLFVIGVVHVFLFWGTILPAYALIGFLLLPFYRAKVATGSKWLVAITGVYLLALIWKLTGAPSSLASVLDAIVADSTLIFLMFLAGFLAAKSDLIKRVGEWKNQIRLVAIGSLPVVAGFSIWTWFAAQSGADELNLIVSLGTVPAVLFYLSSLFLLLEHEQIRSLFTPVSRVGQMALTNYVAQSLIGSLIISIMGLETVSPVNVVIIACLIFIVQIIFSTLWFKFFTMGPLEKMWRFMTYGKQKIK
ncbi:membrane protein [Brevibacillus reuszeri]|uniref:Membrane protein n=1 Tax=Brevibacillus reuszeri TaxID=54915 RepID=A0A0K9Z0C8_9BACL|nr:DUF418 domain-containing protein [Brevibacillus reuszeri]KNB74409.1 hypothetical protein ADS79_01550 [Brevibacillus reuszeri]MED1856321.1 DUF418 domain-containing protein [Brevibacillus reuszeri]GED67984.1 membrane protein [Brevibacillus reuszeri]